MKKCMNAAFYYLVAGVVFEVALAAILEATGAKAAGVGIAPRPMGLIVHTHLLGLGFFFYLLLGILEKLIGIRQDARYPLFAWTYNIGLIGATLVMAYRSFGEIFAYEVSKMLAMGVGTLFHILVTVGLVTLALIARRRAD